MVNSDHLYAAFLDTLNRELATAGCGLRIARQEPEEAGEMLLVDGGGHVLGWVPDHADPKILLAFEQILRSWRCDGTALTANLAGSSAF